MRKRVLVASPVKQRESILREFLESLKKLHVDDLELEFAFIDDHNQHQLLDEFARERSGTQVFKAAPGDVYLCDETTHHWREDLMWRVAGFKDRLIGLARVQDHDFLFLCDSDLYLHPSTVRHLAALEKDIVSEVYWTVWQPGTIPLPQVWVTGQYQLYPQRRTETLPPEETHQRTMEFLNMLARPGTYRVGGLGACTLISRRALRAGVSFSEIYNLNLVGEDRHFCVRAAVLGFELYADTHYPPFHIYRESDLAVLKEYKRMIGGTADSEEKCE